jgi:hypothetical protein
MMPTRVCLTFAVQATVVLMSLMVSLGMMVFYGVSGQTNTAGFSVFLSIGMFCIGVFVPSPKIKKTKTPTLPV